MSYLATCITDNCLNTVEYENKNDIPDNALKIVEIVKNEPIFKIVFDYCTDPENPIASDCPIKFVISDNFRYATGNYEIRALYDEYKTLNSNELITRVNQKGGYIECLSAYVHSGTSLIRGRVTNWDTSLIGFIYIDPVEYSQLNELDININDVINNWIEMYEQYLNGIVYEFRIYELVNNEWELVDNVSDFYDIEDMHAYIDPYYNNAIIDDKTGI